MGRQAYLAKIAFGRSAFEPTHEVVESEEYIQIGSSQSGERLPRRYLEAQANSYIQLYNERGNPINPRSRAYGRRLRDAQNDVLASVGVVERRRSPSEGLPGAYQQRLDELETEETVGNVLALTFTVAENFCTWWIGTLRDRILTFRIPSALPFVQIVSFESAASGRSIAYTGFAPRLASTVCIQASIYAAFAYQPVERLLRVTKASSKVRRMLRRSRSVLSFAFRLGLEVFFYPLTYHASLQRLGLISARPLLPCWKSFIPFSAWSPLRPLSIHHSASGSATSLAKAIVTSPLVLVIAEHLWERWVYTAVFEAIEAFVIRPDNADIASPDAINKDRATSILGIPRKSPPLVRSSVKKLLVFFGWCDPSALSEAEQEPLLEPALNEGRSVQVGDAQLTDVTRLEIATSHTDRPVTDGADEAVVTIPIEAISDLMRPTTPPTPTSSDHDDNDPRIRITSREGIVEMEVRLPPRVISSHTEVLDARPSDLNQIISRDDNRQSARRTHHRVTQLSTEPAQMIGAIVKAQLVGLAVLPFKFVVLRLVASHYLAGQAHNGHTPRFVEPFPTISDLSLRSIGLALSRVALCGVSELAIDFSLWSVQYLSVTTVGQRFFGWGTL